MPYFRAEYLALLKYAHMGKIFPFLVRRVHVLDSPFRDLSFIFFGDLNTFMHVYAHADPCYGYVKTA